MVEHLVRQIRKHYREEVPIVLRSDSGFFDQKLFECFERLGIGYICAGKLLKDLRELSGKLEGLQNYQHKKTVWEYVELGDRRGHSGPRMTEVATSMNVHVARDDR